MEEQLTKPRFDDPYLADKTDHLQWLMGVPGHRFHAIPHLNDFGYAVAISEQGDSRKLFLALTWSETPECFLAGRVLAANLIPELPLVVAPTFYEAVIKLEAVVQSSAHHKPTQFLKPLLQAIGAAVASGTKVEDVPDLYYALYKNASKQRRPKQRAVAA